MCSELDSKRIGLIGPINSDLTQWTDQNCQFSSALAVHVCRAIWPGHDEQNCCFCSPQYKARDIIFFIHNLTVKVSVFIPLKNVRRLHCSIALSRPCPDVYPALVYTFALASYHDDIIPSMTLNVRLPGLSSSMTSRCCASIAISPPWSTCNGRFFFTTGLRWLFTVIGTVCLLLPKCFSVT